MTSVAQWKDFLLDKMAIIGCPYKEQSREITLLAEMSTHMDDNTRAPEDEDIEYVVQCQKGDTEAFAVLVERHQKKMLNIAYRMTGNYEDACDVVQEAFLSAYRSLKMFRRESRFSTWLYRIVVNHTKNRLQQLKARSRYEDPAVDDPPDKEGERSRCPMPSGNVPLIEHIEKRELNAKVQECIGTLDDEHREVLVLRDIQGFSYDEIRDILHIPDGTVKSRLFRARTALKDCLVKIFGDL
jgi:RNA polymerase sigma-70 factor (ECF subfamily)